MKICLTARSASLDADLDPRFGRGAYFLFVETETMELEAVQNDPDAPGCGAGVRAGQLISQQQARALLTGAVGPNAAKVLAAGEVALYTGLQGKVSDLIEKLKKGELKKSTGSIFSAPSGADG